MSGPAPPGADLPDPGGWPPPEGGAVLLSLPSPTGDCGAMARALRPFVVVVLVALIASCGGDDGGETSSPPPSTVPSTTAAPVTLPPPAAADPLVVPVADRTEARFDIIGGPDWLAATDDALWVKVDDGRVVRLDPTTNEVLAEIQAGSDSEICQGIGAGDGELWTCDERDLVRIDPATNEVAARVPVDKSYDSGQIPVAFDHAWVLADDGSVLVGVADDAVDVEFDLGVRCTGIAAGDEALWAACIEDGTVIRIDPATGEVTQRIQGLDEARVISAEGGNVWAGYSGGVALIDAATAAVVGVADAPTGQSGGVFASEGGVWVRTPGELRRVDEDLQVVEEVTVPEESGGSVLVAFGSVWTSAYDDAVVYRLSCGREACT